MVFNFHRSKTMETIISLVNTPLSRKGLYGAWDLSALDSVMPPLGLLSLAAVVRQAGHGVTIIDAFANGLTAAQTAATVLKDRPAIVGLSATTPTIGTAAEIAHILKQRSPGIITVIGGAHLSAVPEETMRAFADFDIGVIGEAEQTIVPLINASCSSARDFSGVEGIIYRERGALKKTAARPPIADLDALPLPAWDLLPSLGKPYHMSIVGTRSARATALMTSRGCPGQCAFCDTRVHGARFRALSSDYVLRMIEQMIATYGIRDFLLYDDTFVVNRKRLEEICRGIIERRLRISWSCCARVDMVNPQMLALMKKAGCWQIEYGIESGSPAILERMGKNITKEQIRNALTWTKQVGIMTRGNFIFGYIGETKETLAETLRFLLELDLDLFQQTFLTPYPGSAVYAQIEAAGEAQLAWETLNNMTINFVPHGLTKDDLEAFSRKAFKKFYLRPRIAAAHLRRLRTPQDMYRLLVEITAFLKTVGGKRP
ncbi:MAG: radical SAM protein [Chitinivibrionales bacterium]|nr:radical SAM protein [Chitinivibrionales bacterium]